MEIAITTVSPQCGMKAKVLYCGHEAKVLYCRHVRCKDTVFYAFGRDFDSLFHFVHSSQPWLVSNVRRISWTIRSTGDADRFEPPPPTSNRGPRLLRAIQDIKSKLVTRFQEIKKDLPMKLFFFLAGFYCATAFSTVIGQTGDWDVLSAALAVLVVECIGALMYRASLPLINRIRSLITMFNYWKTGLSLGLFLDSFKF